MKRKKEKREYRKMVSAVIFGILLMAVTFFASNEISKIIETSCYRILTDSTKQLAADLRVEVEGNEIRMETIADMLSDHLLLTPQNCRKYLTALHEDRFFVHYSLLMPTQNMVYASGDDFTVEEIPDFETAWEEAPELSQRFYGTDGEAYVAYSYPVENRHGARCILYGYVRLQTLAEHFRVYAFEKSCQMYVIDGDSGNFLLDTWHNTLGNIYDGSLGDRKVEDGFDVEKMKKDMRNSEAGYLAARSQKAGETFYSSYWPVGKYNLMVMITVPKSIAFADYMKIRRIITELCGFQLICFTIYLAMLLLRIHRQYRENRRQMKISRFVYEIQRILFDAYQKPELVTEALEKTGEMLKARSIVLTILDKDVIREVYCWPVTEAVRNKLIGRSFFSDVPQLYDRLSKGESILLKEREIGELKQRGKLLAVTGKAVSNLCMVPVLNTEQKMVGTLNAINVGDMREKWEGMEVVAGDFMMALRNMDSYRQLHALGLNDTLTGLKNRNAYEQDRRYYEAKEGSLCCIYVDVNGLHERNNLLGHEAGDQMLWYVGAHLKESFPEGDTYRIGGDEFLLFTGETEEGKIRRRIQQLEERLARREYFVSLGYAVRREGQSVGQMVAEAEASMYREKQRYYNGQDALEHSRKVR